MKNATDYTLTSAKEKPLSAYSAYVVHGECGFNGDCAECAVHDFANEVIEVRPTGKRDSRLWIDGKLRYVEIKTGAGTLKNDCAGSSYMLYIPCPNVNLPLYKQEGFIIKRSVFIHGIKEIGLYRASKATTQNTKTEAIQTFWVSKTNKPHSAKKYNAFLDFLYENGTILQDYFDGLE